MSSNSNGKCLLRVLLTANGRCGCGRPKPTDVFEPTPKPKPKSRPPLHSRPHDPNPTGSLTPSTTTSADRTADDADFTSTTLSDADNYPNKASKTAISSIVVNTSPILPKQSPIVDSVAVEKESEDPHKDFRHSMLQMIFENEIHTESDLHELLECFLDLNSPSQHEIILRAFKEICQEAFPGSNRNKKVVSCSDQCARNNKT